MENISLSKSESDHSTEAASTKNDETVNQLSSGFVKLCEKDLSKVQNSLKEVLTKQDKLMVEMEYLNHEHSNENRQECQQLFQHLTDYKDKLLLIKKQMTNIHQRVKQIKKRTNNLKEHRDREMNAILDKQSREEDLIAKSTSKK